MLARQRRRVLRALARQKAERRRQKAEAAEQARLRRENKRLGQENEILKKAAAFFAREAVAS